MTISEETRAAVRLLLGPDDSGPLAVLLDAKVSTAPVVPLASPLARHSEMPLNDDSLVKAEAASVKLQGGSDTSKNPSRPTGEQETAIPLVPDNLGRSATPNEQQTSFLTHRYNRLLPPAHDKFVKYFEPLTEDGSNYAAWARYSYAILQSRNLDTIVDGIASEFDPFFDQADNRAYLQLSGNVDMRLLNQFTTSHAFEFWTGLKTRFQRGSKNARSSAHTLLRSKIIQPNESMTDHIKKLRDLKSQLENVGGTLGDDDWQGIISSSLMNTKWDAYTLYSDKCDGAEEFISHLLLVASRKQATSNLQGPNSALSASASTRNSNGSPKKSKRTNGSGCTNCGGLRHTIEQCWSPGGGAEGKSTIPGWEIPAHMRNRNPKTGSPTPMKESAQATQESASIAEIDPEFAMIAGTNARNSDWLLDTGATCHMAYDRFCFREYEVIDPITVNQAGLGHSITAIGKGSIIVTFIYGGKTTKVLLTDVLHIPDLASNLLSGTKLTKAGTSVVLLAQKAIFYCNKQPFGFASASGNHYKVRLTVNSIESSSLVTTIKDGTAPLSLWHQRLMHASSNRIRQMNTSGTVDGMSISEDDMKCQCDACLLGKQAASNAPARRPEDQQVKPFATIHTDIEYMVDRSFSGAIYSLKFIDEATGYLWVYAISEKSGATVIDKFRQIDAYIETQFGTRVQNIHSDNGGEFVNEQMDMYLKSRGIVHRLIAPHRHEMNGIAEHINRTGSNAVRTALIDSGLARAYWAEAYHHFAYCHNRTGASFLKPDKTPYELAFGTKPNIAHLRAFGCRAFVRTVPEQRKKLDNKSTIGVYVGVNSDAAYRIMLPTHQLVISRDVLFDETNSNLPCRSALDHTEGIPSLSTVDEPLDAPEPRYPLRETPARLARIEIASAMHEKQLVNGILVPRTWNEAMLTPEKDEWVKACTYEVGKLENMDVWDIVPRPQDTHIIQGMWVFNIKADPAGNLEYRARWVARGDSQIPGEFNDTFAASGDYDVAKAIISMAAGDKQATLAVRDITSAYLHSPLAEDNIFVAYPTGFIPPGGTCQVCHLKRALYGLRQGARAWTEHFSSTLASSGLKQLTSTPSAFYRSGPEGESLMGVYVDDCISKSSSGPNQPNAESDTLRKIIASKFEFKEKDLYAKAGIVLGMKVEIDQDRDWIKISVPHKISRAVDKYNLSDANVVSSPLPPDALIILEQARSRVDISQDEAQGQFPYRSLVGELLWMANVVRIDIAFSANLLARYLSGFTSIHCDMAKRVLKYLKGTENLGIVYRTSARVERPIGFCDSDYGGDLGDRKSISGFVFMLYGGPINWKSKKQSVVALSTAEAEYLALSLTAKHALWLRNFNKEINLNFNDQPLTIKVDNRAAISMAYNPVLQAKTKHIDIPVHHLRDEVKKGKISVEHISGTANPADILTKPLTPILHKKCVELLGMF